MSLLAHVDVAPLLPAQLAALLAVAVAIVPARRTRPSTSGLSTERQMQPSVDKPPLLWALMVAAGLVAFTVVADPRRVLAAAWLLLVLASLAFGPVWPAVNPLRPVAGGIARLLGDPQEAGARALPDLGWWPAVAGLAVLLWASAAPLGRGVVLTVVGVYLVVQLVLALVYGRAWLDRGDGVEALSTAVGTRAGPLLVLAVPIGVALQTQLVTTGTWRGLTAGLQHPRWLVADAALAVACIALAAAVGVAVTGVAVGYLAAWAVTVLLPLPLVIIEDPTAMQVSEAYAAGFLPPLVILVAHGWASWRAGRLSLPLAASSVAGTLLFGPW